MNLLKDHKGVLRRRLHALEAKLTRLKVEWDLLHWASEELEFKIEKPGEDFESSLKVFSEQIVDVVVQKAQVLEI